MKCIADIRLFQSDVPNVDGGSWPTPIKHKAWSVVATRLVMKLRACGYSLGAFDHLYLNLTTCPVPNGIAPAARGVDREHPWYRFYDVQVEAVDPSADILLTVERVLCGHFAGAALDAEQIRACVAQVRAQGEQMAVEYKEKTSAHHTAKILLRYLDNGHFSPILTVTDRDGVLLLHQDLPEMPDLYRLGEIRLNRRQVTVCPRKSALAQACEPLCYLLPPQNERGCCT